MLLQEETTTVRVVTDMVGNTPLIAIPTPSGSEVTVYAKLEMFNPLSSVKDRIGVYMVDGAERRGELRPGNGTIIEATSGNTGIALAAVSAARGYTCVVVMPDSVTVERVKMLEGFGARIVLTPHQEGYVAAIQKAQELQAATPGSWFACQHENPDNVLAHYATTGPEIWRDLGERIDILVCGIGTGGTITGTGRYLREQNPGIKIVGVEPERSPVLTQGHGGVHRIPGLNGGFVANTTDVSLIDEVISVSDADAYNASRKLMRETGLCVGISSGAAATACGILARRADTTGQTLVTIFPDGGDRYLSWIPDA